MPPAARRAPGRFWDRNVPVILLGPNDSDVVDRVRALERGADDYLGRPFSYEELLARIRAVLRRTSPRSGEVVRAGELEIDRVTRVARVLGQRLLLAAREYELLLRLAEHPTRVFTKDELLREVWGFRAMGRTRTLDSHASRVRRKIAACTETPYVINEWGVGRPVEADVGTWREVDRQAVPTRPSARPSKPLEQRLGTD